MGHAELLSDFPQVPRIATLIEHHGSAADHFQIRNLCKIGQNFILHAIREERVLFVAAQIFERQNSDALLGNPLRRPIDSPPLQRACCAVSRVQSCDPARARTQTAAMPVAKSNLLLRRLEDTEATVPVFAKTTVTAVQLLPPIAAAASDPLPDKRRQRLPRPVELTPARYRSFRRSVIDGATRS